MKPDPKVRAAPRPMRVAFLIEDGVDTHHWLDRIFASCLGRHGGRQSLVVPVENAAITPRYAAWLRALDPDVVFTLTYDNAALATLLADLLADTTILERKRQPNVTENHPQVNLAAPALTALSWLPFLKATASAFRARPEHILDSYLIWEDDGFITDNFGVLSRSIDHFPAHAELADFVRPLMLTPNNPPANRWHLRGTGRAEIASGYDILPRLNRSGGLLTLGFLSNLYSKHCQVDHAWRDSFCLMVGDSFLDRVSCWNSALLFDDAQHQAYKSLRVPISAFQVPENASRIAKFLQSCNWLGQSNGPPTVTVRSHSLTVQELEVVANRFRESTMSVLVSRVTSSDECCPEDDKHIHRLRLSDDQFSETRIGDRSVTVPISSPMQVSYCVSANPILSQGNWYLDLRLDRLRDNNRSTNVRDVWTLPLRPQLLRAFHSKQDARILRVGDISVEVNTAVSDLDISQPRDEDFFRALLHDTARYSHYDMRKVIERPPEYQFSKPSDKGRYLQGVLGMFGSLDGAANVLSNHYWRTQLLHMALPAKDRTLDVIQTLQRRLKAKSGELHIVNGAEWQELAERVIQISGSLKAPRYTISYQYLLTAWEVELKAAIEANSLSDRHDEIMAEAPGDLKRSLGHLCKIGIFYRGHEWVCQHCSHRNWVAVEGLRGTMPCEVCKQDHELPIDVVLLFRLNEFLAKCLREHDTLTVIWALSKLQRDSKGSFIYAPQSLLYRTYPTQEGVVPDQEIDVLCVLDGKVVVGEAKPDVEQIRPKHIEALAVTAKELNADVALLCALSDEKAQLAGKVSDLQKLLPAGTLAKGAVADWDDSPAAFL